MVDLLQISRGSRTFFYTNFEVSAMAMWRSQEYLAIFKALDDSGGFFRHRWGDGPVHYLAVRAMLEDSKVMLREEKQGLQERRW